MIGTSLVWTQEAEMVRLMKKLGGPVQCAVRDWVALNTNELTWIALVVGGVLFVGLFMSPIGFMSP
jgi:hypothetical protein